MTRFQLVKVAVLEFTGVVGVLVFFVNAVERSYVPAGLCAMAALAIFAAAAMEVADAR